MDMHQFCDLLDPVLTVLSDLSLDDPKTAADVLARELPVDGPAVMALRHAAEQGVADGWLVPKEMGGIKFGRAAKDRSGFSVDVVLSDGAGPAHRHPNGEIDLLFALEGEPSFDGNPPGWAVYEPGSEHVPGVSGGQMLIIYFLPGGAIEWL